MTIEEGRSIVSVAWAEEQPTMGAQDCSHLIHAVYRKAGFEYPYDSSFELYEGNEHFVRVRFPHSGDLIVWPGHVGIVVDPLLHSFYSLVRTGLEEQDYEGTYWKSRGKHRFYRYRVQNERVLDAAKVTAESTQAKTGKRPDETGFSLESSSSLSDSEENAALTITPKAASKRNTVVFGPQAPAELTGRAMTLQIPSSIIIGPGSRPPTREEVAEGISELNDSAGHVLRTDDPLKVQLPVTVVEQFRVERVDIKRDHGWARVMVNSKVSTTATAFTPPIAFRLEQERIASELLVKLGIRTFRAPQANAFCERLVGTLRRECLDYLIPHSEKHLRRILKEWVTHYNRARPHSSLEPGIPEPAEAMLVPGSAKRGIPRDCRVVAQPVLGGLHHEYRLEKVAA